MSRNSRTQELELTQPRDDDGEDGEEDEIDGDEDDGEEEEEEEETDAAKEMESFATEQIPNTGSSGEEENEVNAEPEAEALVSDEDALNFVESLVRLHQASKGRQFSAMARAIHRLTTTQLPVSEGGSGALNDGRAATVSALLSTLAEKGSEPERPKSLAVLTTEALLHLRGFLGTVEYAIRKYRFTSPQINPRGPQTHSPIQEQIQAQTDLGDGMGAKGSDQLGGPRLQAEELRLAENNMTLAVELPSPEPNSALNNIELELEVLDEIESMLAAKPVSAHVMFYRLLEEHFLAHGIVPDPSRLSLSAHYQNFYLGILTVAILGLAWLLPYFYDHHGPSRDVVGPGTVLFVVFLVQLPLVLSGSRLFQNPVTAIMGQAFVVTGVSLTPVTVVAYRALLLAYYATHFDPNDGESSSSEYLTPDTRQPQAFRTMSGVLIHPDKKINFMHLLEDRGTMSVAYFLTAALPLLLFVFLAAAPSLVFPWLFALRGLGHIARSYFKPEILRELALPAHPTGPFARPSPPPSAEWMDRMEVRRSDEASQLSVRSCLICVLTVHVAHTSPRAL